MCGIAGVVGSNASQAADIVAGMTRALERRGPDGQGLHRFSEAVLGHRRLSIYDLSVAGRQPMLTDDGKIGITFNGAIFNFKTLRRELEALGYVFRSQTDTEVLLHGYHAWQIDGLLSRLRGMVAVSRPPDVGVRDDAAFRPAPSRRSFEGRVARAGGTPHQQTRRSRSQARLHGAGGASRVARSPLVVACGRGRLARCAGRVAGSAHCRRGAGGGRARLSERGVVAGVGAGALAASSRNLAGGLG